MKRYVLPKFKVGLTTDKTYYLPGEKLTGKVQCDYFFGKPTSGSQVGITLSTFDVAFHEFARIEGKTDDAGFYKFEADLPTYFVGQPLVQGNAFIKLDVEVTDKAEHTEKITNTVPIAKDPVIITAVPESGDLKPSIENVVYVLVSAPDGKPVADAAVRAIFEGQGASTRQERSGRTDPSGILRGARHTPGWHCPPAFHIRDSGPGPVHAQPGADRGRGAAGLDPPRRPRPRQSRRIGGVHRDLHQAEGHDLR